MNLRFSCTAALAWCLVRGSTPALAADADEKRLVVVEPSTTAQLSKNAKERLRKAITEVVTRQGILLVPTATLPDRLLHCEIPACLPQIAAATGATLVLQVEARFAKESFKLGIHLWNADEGKLLGKDGRDCPICDEQDLWGSAALLTQGLLEQALRPPVKASPLIPPSAAVAPRTSSQAQLVSSPASSAPESTGEGRWSTYAGIGLAVAGLATLAVGTYYIHVDGKDACSKCDWNRDTAKYGWPLAITGAVSVLGGAGLLTWRLWPAHTLVGIGPGGLRLAGSFQ